MTRDKIHVSFQFCVLCKNCSLRFYITQTLLCSFNRSHRRLATKNIRDFVFVLQYFFEHLPQLPVTDALVTVPAASSIINRFSV